VYSITNFFMCSTDKISLILIFSNALLSLGILVLVSIGYHTSQWAVQHYDCGCDSECIYFIGLFKTKYTKNDQCDYTIKDTSCDAYNFDTEECDSYTAARQGAKVALAIACLMVVWKVCNSVMAWKFLDTRPAVLRMLVAAVFLGDFIIGFSAFISAGQFKEIIHDFPVTWLATGEKVDFEKGEGWNSFVALGVLSWVLAIVSLATVIRGFAIPKTPDVADPPENNA
jgi:hypothetical protein